MPAADSARRTGASCTDEGSAASQRAAHFSSTQPGCKRVSNPGRGPRRRCAAASADLQAAHRRNAGCARWPSIHGRCTVSFQCCAGLTDAGFFEVCRRCPLRHITLKLCAVSAEAVKQVEAERPQIRVVCFESESPSGRGAATSMTT